MKAGIGNLIIEAENVKEVALVEKVRYMISDAAEIVQVETHVLRYWEEELDLDIPRNEMGHRYYTKANIEEFKRIKELKDQGYQLKAIRMLVNRDKKEPMDYPQTTGNACVEVEEQADRRMEQFRLLMSEIIGQAIEEKNESLSRNIGKEVGEQVLKEMDYLMREQDELQEERYRKLDEAIRKGMQKKSLFHKGNKPERKGVGQKQNTKG